MKVFLIVTCVLCFNLNFAQGGRNQGGGASQRQGGMQNNQQQRPETPKFEASKMAGIFNYDSQDVVKLLKLKKDKELLLKVRKAIIDYNSKVDEIALLNSDNFDTLNVFMNSIIKSFRLERNSDFENRRQGGNQGQMETDGDNPLKKARMLTMEKLKPAIHAVREAEKHLNMELESLLNKKQYSKWLKYQKKRKDGLRPKRRVNENNNSGMSSGNRNRGQGGSPGQGGGRR